MRHVLQPSEPLRRRLRIAGWALVVLATGLLWLQRGGPWLFAWLGVALAGLCLGTIPWEYRLSGLRVAGWSLLLLSALFAFVFDGAFARLMMLLLAATGAWFTGLVRLPGNDASGFEHDPGEPR